jgi:hypothetical protein
MPRINPSSDHIRGAKQIGRGARHEPQCWRQQRPRTTHNRCDRVSLVPLRALRQPPANCWKIASTTEAIQDGRIHIEK